MKIEAAVATDVGKRRDKNEDAYLIDESLGLYVVCDGMGGHAAGEVAAAKTVEFVATYIAEHRNVIDAANRSPGGHFPIVQLVEVAITIACQRIYELACSDPDLRGMGTTITLVVVAGQKAIMGHVGDSRLYLIRGTNVHLLSTDHTLAYELVLAGMMTQEEADAGNYGHALTRVVGAQSSVQVESLLFDLLPNDTLMLCSDGFSNYLEADSEVRTLLEPDKLDAKKLVEFANNAGGSDNITTLLMRVTGESPEPVAEQLQALSQSFLCRGMSHSRLLRVFNACEQKSYGPGQKITEPGLYLVVRGGVEGNQKVFGGVCLASDTMQSFSTTTSTTLLFLSKQRFEQLAKKLPKAGRQLYKNLSGEFAEQLTNTTTVDGGDTVDWEPK